MHLSAFHLMDQPPLLAPAPQPQLWGWVVRKMVLVPIQALLVRSLKQVMLLPIPVVLKPLWAWHLRVMVVMVLAPVAWVLLQTVRSLTSLVTQAILLR